MRLKLKPIICLIICASLLFAMPACGAKTFDKPLEGSKDFGVLTDKAVDMIRGFYTRQAITREQKNKLARALQTLAKGGEKGHEFLVALYEEFKTPGAVPQDKWDTLIRLFDADIVDPFISLLEEIASLDANATENLRFALGQVKNVILLLSAIVKRRSVTEEKIRDAETKLNSVRSTRRDINKGLIILDGVINFGTFATAQLIERSATNDQRIVLGRDAFTKARINAEDLLNEGAA